MRPCRNHQRRRSWRRGGALLALSEAEGAGVAAGAPFVAGAGAALEAAVAPPAWSGGGAGVAAGCAAVPEAWLFGCAFLLHPATSKPASATGRRNVSTRFDLIAYPSCHMRCLSGKGVAGDLPALSGL